MHARCIATEGSARMLSGHWSLRWRSSTRCSCRASKEAAARPAGESITGGGGAGGRARTPPSMLAAGGARRESAAGARARCRRGAREIGAE